MKKIALFWCLAIIFCLFAGCNGTAPPDKQVNPEKMAFQLGTYRPEKLIYTIPSDSQVPESFFKEVPPRYRYVFNKTEFYYGHKAFGLNNAPVNLMKWGDLIYYEEELSDTIKLSDGDPSSQGLDISQYQNKTCYQLWSKEKDTGYRVYCLDEEIWLGFFAWKEQEIAEHQIWSALDIIRLVKAEEEYQLNLSQG